MTISEQLREGAIYSLDPWAFIAFMNDVAWVKLREFRGPGVLFHDMPYTDLRIFMLLVAEALDEDHK